MGSDSQSTLAYFESRREELVELLAELVKQDTPSGDAEASRAFAQFYRQKLEAAGLYCREFDSPVGVHLAGDWAPPGVALDGAPDVAIVCHSDTVWPADESKRRPPTVRDGKLYGPGAFDMRAGLLLALAFFQYLAETGVDTRRRFRIFVSADEERGSIEARKRFLSEVPVGTTALVPEPPMPNGFLKTTRKGVGIYSLSISGRASHAGVHPERGISAIDELSRQIQALAALRDPARGITINVGTVSGGTASNVIADTANASVDLRFVDPADGARVDQKIQALQAVDPGAKIEVSGGILFPPMVADERTIDSLGQVVEIGRELGIALGPGNSGGGSDGSLLAANGVLTLDGLGIDGDGAHALDEHVRIDRIAPRAALLTELALRI